MSGRIGNTARRNRALSVLLFLLGVLVVTLVLQVGWLGVASGAPSLPAPTITAKPSHPSASKTASFAFTGEAGATFECKLDGGSYVACVSPRVYTGLSVSGHSFAVRAKKAGKTSGSTSWSWSVVVPSVTITGKPANPTSSTAASLVFTSNASNAVFECRLDAGLFAACVSPQAYAGLSEGSHTFRVRASGPAGSSAGTGPEALWTWLVDLTPPPPPYFKKVPDNPNLSKYAHFQVRNAEDGLGDDDDGDDEGDDEGDDDDENPNITYECSLDGAPYVSCQRNFKYENLSPGGHTVCVIAFDRAGNQSTPTCHTWHQGGTMLPLTISGDAVGHLYPGGPVRPLATKLVNPNGVPITVTSLSVTLVPGTFPAGCLVGDFVITPSNVSGGTPITVPPLGDVTLPDGVNAAGVTAPTIEMTNTPVSQDACKGATFDFDYASS